MSDKTDNYVLITMYNAISSILEWINNTHFNDDWSKCTKKQSNQAFDDSSDQFDEKYKRIQTVAKDVRNA